mmetsp:Transcript_9496/g.15780  ORF Transcript_9496/g.15780 Transcript_9496/m.15780 type:complete len:85 (-) Transcript_9496:232-486(-)
MVLLASNECEHSFIVLLVTGDRFTRDTVRARRKSGMGCCNSMSSMPSQVESSDEATGMLERGSCLDKDFDLEVGDDWSELKGFS